MKILLDSHALLWALVEPARLRREAREAVMDPKNVVWFSAASAWELELKATKGKLRLPNGWLDAAAAADLREMPVNARDAAASARLPRHHADPFDRLLVAQARAHDLRLASRDAVLWEYGIPMLEV